MKFTKTSVSNSVASVLMALAISGQSMVASAAPPPLTIQSEEAAHPQLVKAIREMKDAIRLMEAGPEEFGGYKGIAIRDTRLAIHSLRKALYFRLNMDDQALDRIP